MPVLPTELDLDTLLRLEYPDDIPLRIVGEALLRAPDIVRIMSTVPGFRLDVDFVDEDGIPISPDTPLGTFRDLANAHGARMSLVLKSLQ